MCRNYFAGGRTVPDAWRASRGWLGFRHSGTVRNDTEKAQDSFAQADLGK